MAVTARWVTGIFIVAVFCLFFGMFFVLFFGMFFVLLFGMFFVLFFFFWYAPNTTLPGSFQSFVSGFAIYPVTI